MAASTSRTPAAPGAPPSHRRAARATWWVAYVYWVGMFGTTITTPLWAAYAADFGLSSLMVTVAFAVYAFGVVAGFLLLGRVSDHVGRRPVLVASMLLGVATAVLFLVADHTAVILVARVLSGFSAALVTGAATAAMIDLAPPERRAAVGGVSIVANMGGLAGGAVIAGILAELAPAPLVTSWVLNLALLALAIAALAWIPETVPRRRGLGIRLQRLGVPAAIRGVFLRAALAAGTGFSVLGVLTAVTGLFLAQVLDIHSYAAAGAVVGLSLGGTAVGQLLSRRMPVRIALPAACTALALAGACIAVALAAASLTALVAGSALNGLGTGTASGAGLAAIGAGAPEERRGEATSTFFTILYAMLAVPVIGVGLMARATDIQHAGVVFGLSVTGLALAVLASLLRGARR